MKDSNSNPDAHELPPHAQVAQMAGAHVIAKGIFALAELGVADYLKNGSLTIDELAQRTDTHPLSLYRLMRSMTGFGFFEEEDGQRFSLTPLGAALQSDAPEQTRSTVRMLAGSMMWQGVGEFLHSVKTGGSGVEKAFGMPLFDYLGSLPEQSTIFNEAMIGFHGAEPPAVAAAYDFSGIQKLVDVGGGTGNLLTTILLANPELKGKLYDLPQVVVEAQDQIKIKGLSDRCEVAQGNFFEFVPTGGDAYIMSHIIHDWDEETCLKILENCRIAMQGRGKLLLVEMVIPAGNEFHPSKFLDIVMLTITGGRERTADEYAALFAKAGFRLTRVVPTESPVSVIEAEPI